MPQCTTTAAAAAANTTQVTPNNTVCKWSVLNVFINLQQFLFAV